MLGKRLYDAEQIRVPTMLIKAEWDAETQAPMARGLFASLKNAPYRPYVEDGEGTHALMLEKNRMQLFRPVQAFLKADGYICEPACTGNAQNGEALPLQGQKWRQAMRRRFIALCTSLLCAVTALPTHAAVSVSIGINVPVYPQMVVVPGYPVYYAPSLGANFFFYDGMYWVLQGDNWYMSSWYNGPWAIVEPAYVPYYVLRVPVRYYRAPPPYFRGWQPGAPPRWGNHWGPQWEQRHRDWNQWNRHAIPGPAPLPTYQRRYSGDRYPSAVQQANLQTRNYQYQPRTEVARQHMQQQQAERRGPAVAQQRPQMEQPQIQRAPQMAPPHQQERQHQQERPAQQEPRGGGQPRHEAAPRMQPQQMSPQQAPMAVPNAPQQQQPGRAEQQQERGRGKGHGDEGKDKREESGPHGK